MSGDEVVRLRGERLANSQRSYYEHPPNLVRARGTWFVDEHAHHYLDAINNVTHVGHGHPRVVEAAARQMRRLNTNSRFVYEQMAEYADRLADTLPDPLEVVFLVCTGSEANDLALRITRQVTGRDDVLVIDGAYHGNTTAVTGISPNRYKGSGGTGPPPTTHEVQQPNMYRGPFAGDEDAGRRYANDVRTVAARLTADGRPPAAFIAESLMGTAGQIVHPPGYLSDAFAHVRAAGGVCISDEVQVGFGRLGHRFWGFELGGVVPDIVTMGKPMGNGHPIAALVTTREIADAFDTGMKYFNTFGGNPVSCAVAGAVLDVIEDEQLQHRALETGQAFHDGLSALMDRHNCIGDVRGEGLYLGVEFVDDRATKAPAADLTSAVCERMLERGVIVYPNGDLGNVLKIKPPMVFSLEDVDRFTDQLDATLTEITGG
jgi:4-aminobutyrate aminotransferase-like enzyme